MSNSVEKPDQPDRPSVDRRAKRVIKGDYPRDPSLRGLAAVTFHPDPEPDVVHPCMIDPDADPPPQSTWRRWLAANRPRDPNAPVLPKAVTRD